MLCFTDSAYSMYPATYKQQAAKVIKDTCAEGGVASLENMGHCLPAKSIKSASSSSAAVAAVFAVDDEDELFATLFSDVWSKPNHGNHGNLSREQNDSGNGSKRLSHWCNNEASCSTNEASGCFSFSNLGSSLGSPCIDLDLDLDGGDEGCETDCEMCGPLFSQNSLLASALVPSPSSGIFSPATTASSISSSFSDTSSLETVADFTNLPFMTSFKTTESTFMPISMLDSNLLGNNVGDKSQQGILCTQDQSASAFLANDAQFTSFNSTLLILGQGQGSNNYSQQASVVQNQVQRQVGDEGQDKGLWSVQVKDQEKTYFVNAQTLAPAVGMATDAAAMTSFPQTEDNSMLYLGCFPYFSSPPSCAQSPPLDELDINYHTDTIYSSLVDAPTSRDSMITSSCDAESDCCTRNPPPYHSVVSHHPPRLAADNMSSTLKRLRDHLLNKDKLPKMKTCATSAEKVSLAIIITSTLHSYCVTPRRRLQGYLRKTVKNTNNNRYTTHTFS
jgi:hypothetical protein